jgi:hypothetical protein
MAGQLKALAGLLGVLREEPVHVFRVEGIPDSISREEFNS